MPRNLSKTTNKATRTPRKRTTSNARPQPNAPRLEGRARADHARAAAEAISSPTQPKTTRTSDPVFIGHVAPGLEKLATRELTREFEDAQVLETLRRFDDRTSLILFSWRGDPQLLLDLTLYEDIFVLIADRAGVAPRRAVLRMLEGVVAGTGLDAAERIANPILPGNRRKPTYRVIARQAGEHYFRRTELRSTIEKAVASRHADWALTEDGRYEIWAQLVEDRLVVGLRLSDITMRQRDYKTINLPASLKPTVARAMVTLSRPEDDDIFLDPMCGAGTILFERALAGRFAKLEGGDIDHMAVQAAQENFGSRHRPWEIREWDARDLPFADGEISAIASNLPFGKQIGSHESNQSLYPKLLAEWIRVLKPGGRMVLLTSEKALMRATLKRYPQLVWEQTVPVTVRGMSAEIFVLIRGGDTL